MQIAVEQSGPQVVTSGVEGVVTASACSEGRPLQSGASPFAVDGIPLLGLATETPLWRDLHVGESGEDVRALQTELTRLGHTVEVTGTVSFGTVDAFAALLTTTDPDAAMGPAIHLKRIVWLPRNEPVVIRCPVALGSRINKGQSLADFPPLATGARVTNIPSDAAEGKRRIIVDASAFAVSADGRIEDPAALTGLMRLPSFASAQSTDGQAGFAAKYELTEGVPVLSVPPSALFDVEDSDGCLTSGGVVHRVTVVGSQLGTTFVAGEGIMHLTEVDLAPDLAASCS
ncbi:peptidoglycan-binding domain-containing protein [Paenarthrobacter aurescens]|uniref:peptidoglycan-binding domain-containing protein n=1 Tax=Paenarthrobacter aurescens TaxID=43663 RepID=UPI0021C0088E|nr:hypothetical protein [Paenarthrobacter aurescens]MCT9870475.1 hypothetical protein [Paenarthrobacter aurescens]